MLGKHKLRVDQEEVVARNVIKKVEQKKYENQTHILTLTHLPLTLKGHSQLSLVLVLRDSQSLQKFHTLK